MISVREIMGRSEVNDDQLDREKGKGMGKGDEVPQTCSYRETAKRKGGKLEMVAIGRDTAQIYRSLEVRDTRARLSRGSP